jgi:REP element-mobilizing transposase RayT
MLGMKERQQAERLPYNSETTTATTTTRRQAGRLPYNLWCGSLQGMGHPPRIPIWLPEESAVVYFVTFCVKDRKPVLANQSALRALERAIAKLEDWWVYAGILMPDHLHLLAAPRRRDLAVGNLSAAIKRWMRQEMRTNCRAGAPPTESWKWQTGCFDRLLRSDESAQAKWEYMRENPVRAGLVERWSEWPYSIGFRAPPRL